MNLLDLLLHTDTYLLQASAALGPWIYVMLFVVVFCETGLVVTPFLPGDSLLFALGAMTAMEGSTLDFGILSFALFAAALLGDNTNYFVGRNIGPRIFSDPNARWLNHKYLDRAHTFYDKWGARAIVIARFVPIVRTFVPFVAGIGRMNYSRFISFSVMGAVLWIQLFLWAGRIFGNLPSVKRNFHLVIFAVILLSVLPIVVGAIRARKSRAHHV